MNSKPSENESEAELPRQTSQVHPESANPFLVQLYEATYSEISRLRDYEWRIAYYFIVLGLAALGLALSADIRPHITVPLQWLLSFFLGTGQVLGLYLLGQTHLWLTQQRNIRRRLEDLMGFYDKGIFADESLLPWKGRLVRPSFQLFDLVLPLGGGIVIVNTFAIFLVWVV